MKEISSGSAYISTYINKNQTTRSIHFDYCFICTGSKYASPMKINTHPNIPNNIYHNMRAAEFEEIYSKLSDHNATKTIGIIGGGPSGVELMAEISEQFPDKKVCHLFPKIDNILLLYNLLIQIHIYVQNFQFQHKT